MASYDFDRPTEYSLIQPFEKVGSGIATPTMRKYFFQRAWNTAGGYYETWISEGAPADTPPSGDAVTNLTRSAFWRQVV